MTAVMAAPIMPQRRQAISWHLPSWPMKAARYDLRSHYRSMMRDRCDVNMSGIARGAESVTFGLEQALTTRGLLSAPD